MSKRFGFRPKLREQLHASNAAQRQLLAAMDPSDPRYAANKARLDSERAEIKPVSARAAPRQLEAPVVAAVAELLRVHPKVLWAARFNSGAAGDHSQVKFHWFVRRPEKMRLPDFYGELGFKHTCGAWTKPLAIEVKAPGWTKPRDDREREQAAFLAMIRSAGGVALFATSAEQVAEALA